VAEQSPPGFRVVFLTVLVDQLGFGIVIPILPLYADDMGAPGFAVGALLSTYSAVQMLAAPLWGRVSDRIGRRPVIALAAAGTCAGFIVIGLAQTLVGLFVGRALLGACGVSLATAQAWVADTQPERRGPGIAILGGAAAIGFTLGPALGGLGVGAGGYRLPFYIAAGLAGTNALLAALAIREPARRARAAAGRAAFSDAFRIPALVFCMALFFVVTYAFSNIEATFALYTTKQLGYSAEHNAYLFVYIGLIAALTQLLATRPLLVRIANPKLAAIGLAMLGAGACLVPLVARGWQVLAALTLMAIGYSLCSPAMTAMASRAAPAERQGEMLGMAQSASALARIAGPTIGGLLFDAAGRPWPFLSAAILLCSTALVTMWWARRTSSGAVRS
jgi:DHA1 family tetracycline resistance protein-like MFS transporter